MSSTIACPGCKARLHTRPEYAGKKIRCPKCSEIVRVPIQEVQPLEKVEVVGEIEELDDIEEVEEERGVTEERPARRRERPAPSEERRSRGRVPDIRKKRTKYAPCPECDGQEATRVVWTPWGSFYGPAMFTHVRCDNCGHAYNGNTGGSNLVPAILFVTVTVLVGLGLIGSIVFMIIRIK
jgi:DNA-directed RNA polymerase subunit M/transcription elongation factor TFIIS